MNLQIVKDNLRKGEKEKAESQPKEPECLEGWEEPSRRAEWVPRQECQERGAFSRATLREA